MGHKHLTLENRGKGQILRVPKDIEAMVRELSDILGYEPHTIRNTALLYGLSIIAISKKIPNTDVEFIELLEETKKTVRSVVEKWLGKEVIG